MIGATTGAMPMPGPSAAPAQPGACNTDAAAAERAQAGARDRNNGGADASASTRTGAGARRAVDRSGRRDDARPDEADANPGRRGFAELLEGDAATAPTKAARPATDGESKTSATPANLPEQLLALLAGHPAAPAAGQPPGSASGEASTTPGGSNAKPLPSPLPAIAHQAANAAGETAPAAPAGDAPFAALVKVAGEETTTGVDGVGNIADASEATQVPSAPPTAGPAAAQPRAAAILPGAPLTLPPNPDAGFDDGFGARVAWMAEQRLGHAEIRLNPEHIGPIDVRVQLDGDRVNAEFHSAHAEVRHALEASVPRLRELLGQHGLQLGQADVGQRQAWQQSPARDGTPAPARNAGGDETPQPAGIADLRMRSRRLLDEYA